MDLPSKNMYDVFKDDIWKELGPLDPNWFEVLTTQTTVHQGNVSDQEYTCTYQEGHFKTPLEKTSVDSQLFSTPKVFRHSRILSPETEDEQSFTNANDKGTLPWTAADSPCILRGVPGVKCGSIQPQNEDSFDLLNTPNKSPVSYAKHISESLGAQINPDISWTSSLNTPPAVPSTLILSKTDESPCPVSVTADRNVVFVRKLFPSVSEASTVGVPKNLGMPVVSQGPVSSEAHNCPQTSQNQRESLWSQKVQDSIKDGEICNTVAGALDGAEKVPSVLFANSSSDLRKVKPDRNKRKQIVQTKDGCSSKDVTTTPNAASREKGTANLEPGKFPSSPLKTEDKAISQWSPLRLSEIPPCTEESKILAGHPQGGIDSLQLSRPSVKISDSGFIRKRRKFVYTVGTLKPQIKENEVAAQKMDSSPGIPDSGQEVSVKQLEKASDEANCCSTGKTAVKKLIRLSGESLLYSAEAKIQDLDMSQLCRDFAQDFSQMSESGQQTKVAENTQQNFSPSACLSAVKQAKQKARQANFHHNSVGSSDRRHISTANQNSSINEDSGSDSGFQSAFSNIAHTTALSFGPPCSENTGQSRQWSDSTTDIHMTTSFPATKEGNEKVRLDAEAETTLIGGQRSNQRQTVDLGRESESCIKSTLTRQPSSTEGTDDNIGCVPLNGLIHGSLPEKSAHSLPSVHALGFKTASNKGIHVSSANLERAKRLFQETDDEKAFSGQPIKCDNAIKPKSSTSKSATCSTDQLPSLRKTLGSQLTASQRADVTELCSLLEEADSQFEFTQFKTAKQKRHGQRDTTSPQKADKEVDPEFLAGIDFDDSFNDGISNATIQSTDMSSPSTLKKGNSSGPPSSERIFEDGRCSVSTELENPQRAEHSEAREMENNSTLLPVVAFKTAGGRVLRVSKKCLSKARSLFADLEENLTDQKSPGKQKSETDTKTEQKSSMDFNTCEKDLKRIQDGFSNTEDSVGSNKQVTVVEVEGDSGSFEKSKTDKAVCQSGFHMASGKRVSVSVKCMQQAEAFFKDCGVMDSDDGEFDKRSINPVLEDVGNKKSLSKYKNIQVSTSEEPASGCTKSENVDAGLFAQLIQGSHVDEGEMSSNGTLALKNTASLHENPFSTSGPFSSLLCTTSKNTDPSGVDELGSGDGFCTASGKKVSVSADAMKRAECLLNEMHRPADINSQPSQKGKKLGTGQLTTQVLPTEHCGFQTAGGKGLSISLAALKKAKNLFSECEGVENKISVSSPHSKIPATRPTLCNRGFFAASGKAAAFSSEALQKAKAFFSDISSSTDMPSVSDTRSDKKHKDAQENFEQIHCGVTNAEGAEVRASQKNLLTAKHVSKELDDFVLTKAMQEADAFFNDCEMDCDNADLAKDKKSKVLVSVVGSEEKNLTKLNPDRDTPEEPGNGCAEDIDRQVKQKQVILPPQKSGFQTASGNAVAVSSENLKRAKTMFNECEGDVDGVGTTPPLSQIPALPFRGGGFRAASGKPVELSSEALQKAKSLFGDISFSAEIPGVSHTRKSDKKHHSVGNTEKRQLGFTTAGGAKVHVSQKSLMKAKHLMKEFSDSAKAVQEADAFFNDCEVDTNNTMLSKDETSKAPLSEGGSEKNNLIPLSPAQKVAESISEEPGNGCTEDADEQVNQRVDTLPAENNGFQTASGKAVAVSSENLKRAKTLFNECEGGVDGVGTTPPLSQIPALPFRGGGFRAASGKPVELSSEALQKAKSLFGDISFSAEIPGVSHTRKSDKTQHSGDNTEKRQLGFTTAGGAKVRVSQKSLMKAKHLMKEFSDSAKAVQDTNDVDDSSEMSANHLSIAPMSESGSKKENLSKLSPGQMKIVNMSGNRSTEDTDGQVQNIGFQTAGGKAVAISSEALKRAETLLSEFKGAEDKIVACLPRSISTPPFKNSGFFAASGKPVEFSAEALENVKTLFSDISMSADIPSASDTRTRGEDECGTNDTEKVHCGFRTAKGGKVHVSEENLLKAKHVLKEFDDLILTQAMQDADAFFKESADGELERSKVKDVKRTSNSNAATASDGDIPARRRAPSGVQLFPSLQPIDHRNKTAESLSVQDKTLTDVFKCQEDQIVSPVAGNIHGKPGQEKSCLLECEVIRADKSSDLNLQSLNLTGCTENQQKLFAQEALDCTNALLKDEGLGGQSLSMTFETEPLKDGPKFSNKSTEEETGRRKRTFGDSDLTGQPPLKRRLLEEFDRTVDGPRGSALHPVKSCPNGLMKDRGVFKYSVHHQPNITKPHRDGKNYVDMRFQKTTQAQGSAPGGSGSAHSKMPTFVPPIFKNTKTEAQKNPVFKENVITPVFVPPLPKKRTLPREDSPEQHGEEDKSQHSFIMQSNSNSYVPPTKKIQGTADVKTLVDTENNDMNNQSVPVDCGSVGSGAESSHVEDTFSRSRDISQNLQNIELARDMQDMRIRKKKRQNIRPLPGSLFLTRTSGVTRIPLKVAVNGKPPARYTSEQLYGYGVQRHVSEISSENAESFRFNLLHFIKQETLIDEGGVQLADGGWLMPSNDWTAGKDEFFRALCDTPGVDPKLIGEAWVYNHYKWIVWKQASVERSFPETMGGLCLSPEQVLLQLKYRYDIEVDHSRRPALRKIMERDDTAVKTLVLCVCEIVSRGHSPNRQNRNESKTPQSADTKAEASSAVVWLTDGWYAIKAQLDEPLAAMLHRGLLAVGVKLIIHGAQLVGSQDACCPLEAPESLMLKICANSCRRARWDAKLGFHRDPRPFLLPISCLYSNGGSVGCVDIIILRSYPIQWMERKPDGHIVFRSARAEEKEARRYNGHKQKAMEMLFAKIQADFEKEDKGNIKPQRRRQTISHQDIAKLQDGEELYEAVGDDLAYLQAHLSEQQLEALHSYRRSVMDKKQAELQDRYRRVLEAEDNENSCPKRDVTPVWRLCITDSTAQPGCSYQLNLWRPSSDLQSLLKEGCRYKVYNLVTSDGKRRSSIETVQLTGTKKTQFQELKSSQEWLAARFQPRVSTDFVNLLNAEFQPLCGEVDLTGYVISVIDGQGCSPAFYLADGKLNFVKVRFFSSLSQAGLEDVIKPHALLALTNLQLRGQSIFPTPVVYAGDLTVFSTNPKEVHLQESLIHLKSLLQRQENFFLNAEEKLSQLVNSEGPGSISSLALQPRTPASTTERKQDPKTTVTFQKGTRSLGSFTPVSNNPPAASTSTEKDPKSLKRRRALDYLSRVPSPPPLSFLGSLASPCVKKTFNPPRRSGTPSTLKAVQTPIKKPADSVVEDEWVNDEELAMIDTQALHVGDSL
ncbi:breast cancer type 2 susceptibility protein [Odontesthes bonariensis]|uniref:breast cancer type 2 susceptibility protein n=1 Tax=Odontesthes bonariensis TaxID=219752 RepID=UPI003F58F387